MMDIEHITLNISIPNGEVRIVAMQPFIKFHSENEEPYRWAADAESEQLAAINRTLNIAQNGFDDCGANFTLFPEYAIPGIVGVVEIEKRISSNAWPNESIVIAGVHGIPKNEYSELCNLPNANFSPSNSPDKVPVDKWVNCCVVWAKDRDGNIQKWVQPKIRPAFVEMNTVAKDMFRGKSVYVFECEYEPIHFPCRFVALICYDWVASGGETNVRHELLSNLTNLFSPNIVPLHWIFVVQHNPNPNHQAFLDSTHQFLKDTKVHPYVLRDNSIVVHVNTAASKLPTRKGTGGFSACVFSPRAQFVCRGCRPTVCMQPKTLRGSETLGRCKDVVFREMGECIHSFTVRVPKWVNSDASDKTIPLPWAHVHATNGSDDPRLCGGPVPAAVKWLNDQLDYTERLSAIVLADSPHRSKAETIEPNIIYNMRAGDHQTASDTLHWAASSRPKDGGADGVRRKDNADIWDDIEADALSHVLHSLTVLGLAYSLEVEDSALHVAVLGDNGFVQVVAILGETHDDCRKHFDTQVHYRGTDPVLLISRNRHNTRSIPGEHRRIDEIDDDRGMSFIDYDTLVTSSLTAPDRDALKGIIDDYFPANKRFI